MAEQGETTQLLDHHDHETIMMGEYDHGTRKDWHPETFRWQFLHAFLFLLGGTTFLAGTVVLFSPGWDFVSAALYTIGSVGFFAVDVQEFFTFDGVVLRTNILMSITGSFLYIVGSVGFFPVVVAWNSRIGVWGFVLGSLMITWSQKWKTHRIGGGESPEGFSVSKLISEPDAFTAAGVELSAALGATHFLLGTLLYDNGPLEGPASVLKTVLMTWTIGSCWFTIGGCFLAWRHAVMRVV